MCGIIGILGTQPVAPLLLDGLKRLEYRGYDSAGVATLVNGHIERRRAEGKLVNLATRLEAQPLAGDVGIGHTRWATHGGPTERNAHPHATDRVAVVHNGIIENFQELRHELEAEGAVFETETDTEAVVHLLTHLLNRQMTPREAAAAALKRLEGAFALAMIFAGEHELMIAARRGAPLAVGFGRRDEATGRYDGMYLGSDAIALAPLSDRIAYLEEGDWVEVTPQGAVFHDRSDAEVSRAIQRSAVAGAMIGKGQFRHYMLKEIHEQPAVVGDTLRSLVNLSTGTVALPDLPVDFTAVSRLTVVACGTASFAGHVAKYWFEQLARLPVELDIASEFRYREGPLPQGGAALFVSQSGETADTLAALHYAREHGQTILGVVNVPESSIARAADATVMTLAGPEIGVASTKAFTTQLTALLCLALEAARQRGTLTAERIAALVTALAEVPARLTEVLEHDERIRAIAHDIAEARDVLYIGRGTAYPMALEGALKLKEISYIHAEGYAAGEMKHGPIALIDENVPVIVLAPSDALFDKTASNVQEAIARGGQVAFLSDAAGIAKMGHKARWSVTLPAVDPVVAPILYAVPVQLLAYHVAVIKGTDVDQPRNLAKSVTVE